MSRNPGPLRVLWVIKGLGPGGAERLLVTLAQVRDRSEIEYEVAYLLSRKQHLVPTLEGSGVATHLVGSGRHGGVLWPRRLRRLIVSGRFDVVHTHSPALASVARLLVRTMRRRPVTVYTEHNHWQAYGQVTRRINKATHGLDDQTYAVSHAVLGSIEPPSRRADVDVLIHGIDRDELTSIRPRADVRRGLAIPDADRIVITVANIRPQKNYPDLLSAAERVLAERDDVHFVAVGQGPLLESTRDDVRRRGISDRFQMLGLRDDIFDLLGAADAFVLASVWEGFPIAVMEAMSMGLPCVATRVGGVPDAIDDGVEGLLVEPRDPAGLADALLWLLADEGRRKEMSVAAEDRARSFDIRTTSDTLATTYRRLTRG
jgi:glycosyltransferase involved in cell wall biosynthesis